MTIRLTIFSVCLVVDIKPVCHINLLKKYCDRPSPSKTKPVPSVMPLVTLSEEGQISPSEYSPEVDDLYFGRKSMSSFTQPILFQEDTKTLIGKFINLFADVPSHIMITEHDIGMGDHATLI